MNPEVSVWKHNQYHLMITFHKNLQTLTSFGSAVCLQWFSKYQMTMLSYTSFAQKQPPWKPSCLGSGVLQCVLEYLVSSSWLTHTFPGLQCLGIWTKLEKVTHNRIGPFLCGRTCNNHFWKLLNVFTIFCRYCHISVDQNYWPTSMSDDWSLHAAPAIWDSLCMFESCG